MSKIATIIGFVIALIILFLGMMDFEQGRFVTAFINVQGLLLVIGGTFAAVLINYPFSQISCVWNGTLKTFTSEPEQPLEAIENIIQFSYIVHKKGELALEKEIEFVQDPFLRFGLSEMMVYKDIDQIQSSLENHLNTKRLRHMACQEMFQNMASYAPAFGMMGTVMGLIMMMTSHMGADPVAMGSGESQDLLGGLLQGMGLALVTTFYGVMFANFIFIPIAGKLKVLSEAETLKDEILIQGILRLKGRTSPIIMQESLTAFLNQQNKQKLDLSLGR